MNMDILKTDILILLTLQEYQARNKINAIKVVTLAKECKVCTATIKNRIKLLYANKYVDLGFQSRTAKTYYITEKGERLLADN